MTRPIAASLAVLLALLASCTDRPLAPIAACDWPTEGRTLARTFSQPCETAIAPTTVAGLERRWFVEAPDAVTAPPAIVDGVVYVGDWSGIFYAIRLTDGEELWRFTTEPHPGADFGQITRSATVADVGGRRLVFFAGGKSVYALRADNGGLVWRYTAGTPKVSDPEDPTEILSAPAVADGLLVIGTDLHNRPGAGKGALIALDARTGDLRWRFEPEAESEPMGCGGIWAVPSVDLERRTVYVGTASCPSSPDGWTPHTEALIALELDTGRVRWSFQPHAPNNNDFDFGAAPNLFSAQDRDLVGLGNKDGFYYALSREGTLVWKTQVQEPTVPNPNFSAGGIGNSAVVAGGRIVAGTGIGSAPFLHALDAATGEILWQQPRVGPTFAAPAEAAGVVFAGGIDFTFRALDLATGDILWEFSPEANIASSAAIVGDWVVIGLGFRQPGGSSGLRNAGVVAFSLPEASAG